jgi:hypothetical protein
MRSANCSSLTALSQHDDIGIIITQCRTRDIRGHKTLPARQQCHALSSYPRR